MQSLPISVIYNEIMTKLAPKDKLAIAMTCKPYYSSLFENEPEFKDSYGKKHKMGQCLYKMISFIRTGSPNVAYWSFSYLWYHNIHSPNHPCLTFKKTGKNQTIHIHTTKKTISVPKLMNFVEHHLWPYWQHIEMHTGCWYKSKTKMREFQEITNTMMGTFDKYKYLS